MKTTTTTQQEADQTIAMWEHIAAATRNPIECAFGILNNRFSVLKSGLQLHHEDDCGRVMMTCAILHNLCITA